jgi:hypothetical protein
VSSEAYAGDPQKNPYNFKLKGLTDIQLLVDGVSSPGRPIRIAEDGTPNSAAPALASLFDTIGGWRGNSFGNNLDLEGFVQGFALLAFPVYGAGVVSDAYAHVKRTANIRIEGKFSAPLATTVTAIVYAEFPGLLEIEASRNVIIS